MLVDIDHNRIAAIVNDELVVYRAPMTDKATQPTLM
jgi:hypothetical protein